MLVTHEIPIIRTDNLTWHKAAKTKPIRAKPLASIMNDLWLVFNGKLQLVTLEGPQPLKQGSFICRGIENEVWQQESKKLHDKYNPTVVDSDGWTVFEPKPGLEVNVCQITVDHFKDGDNQSGGFGIEALWGKEFERNGVKVQMQYGCLGDYVAQVIEDPKDVYIIARKIYDNTYATV